MQCPRCGRETDSLIEGMCAQCASERFPVLELPPTHDATQCAHCGRVLQGSSWKALPEVPEDRMREILRPELRPDARVQLDRMDVDVRMEDVRNASVRVTLEGHIEGHRLERVRETRIRLKNGVCGDCSREMGGYYEAILQVRNGTPPPPTDPQAVIEHRILSRLANLREAGRPNAFLTKVERTRHGHDYYFGNHELARILATELAERYGAEQGESTKLVGRKDGRDMLRWTLLVRLPPYEVGDFIDLDGSLHKIISFDRKNLVLLDVDRQERIRRERHRIPRIRIVGRAAEQQDAIVVSRTPGHVQVLDPVSLATVDLPEAGIPADGKTVPIFRWEEVLHPVLDPGD